MTTKHAVSAPAMVAGVAPLATVLALLALVLANRHDEPLAFALRIAAAFVAPMVAAGAIAAIAVFQRSPLLEVVAGVLLSICSVFAFSGVTLVLLVPATLLFHLAATEGEAASRRRAPSPTSRRRWLLVIVAAALTAPVVVVVAALVGMLGVVIAFVVVLALIVLARTLTRVGKPNPKRLVYAVGIVVLVIAGALALFTRTEQQCWARVDTPSGPVESLGAQEPATITVVTGAGSGGCGPVATPDGFALGLGLLLAAVLLAWNAAPMIRTDGRPSNAPRPERR